MKSKSNQLHCTNCGNRKFKIYNRKNSNVCSCGSMMEIYEKKKYIPYYESEILYAPLGFEERGGEHPIQQLMFMGDENEEEQQEEGETELINCFLEMKVQFLSNDPINIEVEVQLPIRPNVGDKLMMGDFIPTVVDVAISPDELHVKCEHHVVVKDEYDEILEGYADYIVEG